MDDKMCTGLLFVEGQQVTFPFAEW